MEMEKVKKELMHMFHAWRILLGSLVKWILLSIVIGGVIGVIASAFANLITWATDFRMGHMWMVYLLPFAGLMIVFLYHVTGQEKNAGTDMVLMVVRSDQNTMPGRVAPLILIATALTHLFGGSAGREGAALQFGASLGNWLGRKIHLNESDKRIMTLPEELLQHYLERRWQQQCSRWRLSASGLCIMQRSFRACSPHLSESVFLSLWVCGR